MRRICAFIMICAPAFVRLGLSNDLPDDVSKALLTEWNNTATTQNCLTALRLYATRTAEQPAYARDGPKYTKKLLGRENAEKDALDELLKGAAANEDLYTAQKQADLFDELAKASPAGTLSEDDQKKLFGEAAIVIRNIYDDSGANGKRKLAAVQANLTAQAIAISKLLDAYPQPKPIDDHYTHAIETLRACYKINALRLFTIVSNLILGPKT